jgi:hypothetical protein
MANTAVQQSAMVAVVQVQLWLKIANPTDKNFFTVTALLLRR